MAEATEFSQFHDDFMEILSHLTADVKAAMPFLGPNAVYIDRSFSESNLPDYAVIVPLGISMRGAEEGAASIPQVEQEFSFRIFIRRKIRQSENVIAEKSEAANALVALLMADIRYKNDYERPFVPAVDFEEEKPSASYHVTSIDFVVRCANWRHQAR